MNGRSQVAVAQISSLDSFRSGRRLAALLRGHKAGERVRFGFNKPGAGKTPIISRISAEGAR